MDIITELLPDGERPKHPKLRIWQQHIDGSPHAHIVFFRKADGLRKSDPTLSLECFDETGRILWQDDTPWDTELNAFLIKLHVKCQDKENEAERFGYTAHKYFDPIEAKYGDGYFNIAIYDLLKRRKVGSAPRTAAMLGKIYRGNAIIQDSSDCFESIEYVLKILVSGIHDDLSYSVEDSSEILDQSIALYLDDRFSVGLRGILGL